MDYCSFFIPERALFGSYPLDINILEDNGITHFIDLTAEGECVPYITKGTYIKFPIGDRRIPEKTSNFEAFVDSIIKLLNDKNNKLYIHCRGGHGRAGLLVACILGKYLEIPSAKALELTNKCHSERKIMDEKWRKLGSPQTYGQKMFVNDFLFQNILPQINETKDTKKTTVVRIRRKGGVIVRDCDVYIGRRWFLGGWSLPQSKWHNPFTVKSCDGSPEKAVEKYRQYIFNSPNLLKDIEELRGKTLGCWCSPSEPCHGNVLIDILNGNLSKN